MSTRSRIGILQDDLSVKSVYHHWDGYPEWLGVTLEQQYNTREKVAKLIDGGNMSSCYSDSEYDYEKQEYVKVDPRPNYYGGEDEKPHHNNSIQDFLKDARACEEFLYLFTSEGWRAWSVRPMYDKDYNILNTDTTPVEIPEEV
tara:strand:- start:51 stop:482 length:432 start_codon:yes stop_codon:yes gene_type:complete